MLSPLYSAYLCGAYKLHPLELICSYYQLALNILFCSIYFIGQAEWSRNGIPFEYFMLCSVFSFPEVEDMVISCTLRKSQKPETKFTFILDFFPFIVYDLFESLKIIASSFFYFSHSLMNLQKTVSLCGKLLNTL